MKLLTRLAAAAAGAFLVAALLPGGALRAATTFTVTSASNGGPGTLRNGISTSATGTTIVFDLPPGTTITLSSELAFNGKELTIVGPGADQLTIDGNGVSRIFNIGASAGLTLSGVTLTGGFNGSGMGGAILNAGETTLTSVHITDSVARGGDGGDGIEIPLEVQTGGGGGGGGGGGAIFNTSTGELRIVHSALTGNEARGGNGGDAHHLADQAVGGGGGAGFGGAIYNYGLVEIIGSTLSGNVARGGNAGLKTTSNVSSYVPRHRGGVGFGADGGTHGTIDAVYAAPAAENGGAGGIIADGLAHGSHGGFGGGGGGSPFSAVLAGNGGFGGGAGGHKTGTTADPGFGGGVGGVNNPGAGGAFGGAIFNDAGHVLIHMSTITANTVTPGVDPHGGGAGGYGGGIFLLDDGHVSVGGSIVAGNSASATTAGPDFYKHGATLISPFVSNLNNVFGCLGTVTFSPAHPSDLKGASCSSPLDPKLQPLADNGGPTPTHALKSSSPAIDHGGISGGEGASFDQRGIDRGPSPDAGAYEDATVILSQPAGTSFACAGGLAAFHVEAIGSELTYRWRRNGNNLSTSSTKYLGVTTPSLHIAGTTLGDNATFDVVVTGPTGPVTSDSLSLVVKPLPEVAAQPQNHAGNPGGTATFTAAFNEPGGDVVWLPMPAGAVVDVLDTTTTLTLPPLTLAMHNTTYQAQYTTECGTVTTNLATLSVTKLAQTITFEAPDQHTFGTTLTLDASVSSDLPLTYTLVSGPATLAGRVLTVTGLGNVVVRVSQPGNSLYTAATPVEQTITVVKGDQTIAFTPPASRTFPLPISLGASATSGLLPTFTIVSGPATLSVGGTIATPTGVGTVVVRASQNGNPLWNAATPVERSIEIVKGDLTITFNPAATATAFTSATLMAASTLGPGGFTFSVVSGPASVTGNTLQFTGAGTVVVRASHPGNANYNPASADRTIAVGKATPVISFEMPAPRPFNVPPLGLTANDGTGLPISFTLLSGPATLGPLPPVGPGSRALLTLTGPGEIVVRATQPGNDNWESASVERSMIALKRPQELAFTPPASLPFGESITLSAAAESGGAVTFELVSAGGAMLAGNTLSITGPPALHTLVATQAGDDTWDPITETRVISGVKGTPSLTFDQPAPHTFGAGALPIVATSPSGAPSLAVLSGPGALIGNMLTATGAGDVVIRASLADTATHHGIAVDRTITILPAADSIAFEPPAGLTFGDPPVALTASTASGLDVTFTILAGPGSLSGATLTPSGPGTIVVRASRSPHPNYVTPVPVDRSIVVAAPAIDGRFAGSGTHAPDSPSFRATLSVDVTTGAGLRGSLTYHYSRARVSFVSTAVTSATLGGGVLSVSGDGSLNGSRGHTFVAIGTDAAPDQFEITIRNSGGAVVFSGRGALTSGGFSVTPL